MNDHDLSQLKSKFYEALENQGDARKFALIYMKEAKIVMDPSKIAEAYYFLSLSSENQFLGVYLDSLIEYSTKKNLPKYLCIGYQEKGKKYFDSGEIDKALESYINALKHIDKEGRSSIYFILTHNIAIIKDLIGQKKEALEIYQNNYNYFLEDEIKNSEVNNYLNTIFALAHSYTENTILDSATIYNHIGYKESIKYNSSRYLGRFILGEGYNLYYKKNYHGSLDSIEKAIPILKDANDNFNLTMGYLFAAKNLAESNIDNLKYLLLADSIISIENRYYPQYVEVYELLYKSYKQEENRPKQLLFLEKLINYNTELRDRYNSLYSTIVKEYDQPNLLKEKEELISELENAKRNWTIFLLIGSILFLGSIFLAAHNYNRRVIYKKRFDDLFNQDREPSVDQNLEVKSKIHLSEDLVEKVLAKMDHFERTGGFLSKEISLTKLAVKLETNSNYLSRIINHIKGKNYSSYINDLRIDFVLNELLENQLLRKYTIKAIAHEIGFRNSESFSSAFYKRVGLYPSFYIKELNKRK